MICPFFRKSDYLKEKIFKAKYADTRKILQWNKHIKYLQKERVLCKFFVLVLLNILPGEHLYSFVLQVACNSAVEIKIINHNFLKQKPWNFLLSQNFLLKTCETCLYTFFLWDEPVKSQRTFTEDKEKYFHIMLVIETKICFKYIPLKLIFMYYLMKSEEKEIG